MYNDVIRKSCEEGIVNKNDIAMYTIVLII